MWKKRSFIILDIQGFIVNNNDFEPKELASYDSEHHISHFIFQQSRSYSSLSAKNRNTANFLSNSHHCIEWYSGFTPLSQFDAIVTQLSRTAMVVYVKGFEKAEFLRRIINTPIVQLDDSDPSIKLQLTKPMCPYHKRENAMCSLSNVNYLFPIVCRMHGQV